MRSESLIGLVFVAVGVTAALAVGATILSVGDEFITEKVYPTTPGLTREQMYSPPRYSMPPGPDELW